MRATLLATLAGFALAVGLAGAASAKTLVFCSEGSPTFSSNLQGTLISPQRRAKCSRKCSTCNRASCMRTSSRWRL